MALRLPGVEASTIHTLKVGGLGRAAYDAGTEQGVLVRPVGDSAVMAPPLVITEAEIKELVRRLQKALDEVLTASS